MTAIPLPWRTPPLTLNQRMHWADRNRKVREIHTAVAALARDVPKVLPPVQVVLVWTVTDARKRDTDNPALTTKACIDALVSLGWLPADHWQVVPVSYCRIELGPKAGLRLEISEWQEEVA